MEGSLATPQVETARPSKIFYGWWVVLACSIVALCASSSRYAFSMFFPFVLDDLGWTRATVGLALTLHMVVGAVSVLYIGKLVDRFGGRWIMAGGGILLLLGLVLLSTLNFVWQFYLYYSLILALGMALTYTVPGQATARKWFVKRAGLAVSIVTVGSGLGLAAISPLSRYFINSFGWRTSYVIIGVSVGLLAIIASVLFIRKDPESMGLLPDGAEKGMTSAEVEAMLAVMINELAWTVKEAVKTRSFWCFILAPALGGIALTGTMFHMGAWGNDIALKEGISLHTASSTIAVTLMLMALIATGSRLLSGALSDKIGRKPMIYAYCVFQVIAFVYALSVDSLSSFLIFGVLNGWAYGLVMPIWAPLLGDIFGRLSLATLFGVTTCATGIIGGMGATLFGVFYDQFGSYNWGFILGIIMCGVTALLTMLIRTEEKPGERGDPVVQTG